MEKIVMDKTYFEELDKKKLTEDELAIRDAVRGVLREHVWPYVKKWDEGDFGDLKDKFGLAKHFIKLMTTESGLYIFGSNLDLSDVMEDFPGPISETAYGVISREVEAVDSAFRSVVSVQSGLTMWGINKWGNYEQRKLWLPKLYKGEAIGAFGLTEPQGGSDPGFMTTRAKKEGSDWILNGRKEWITNASVADISIVYAKCEDGLIRGFLVEKGMPGYTSGDYHKWSLNMAVTSWMDFQNVRVPKENLLPGTEDGKLAHALAHLTQARYTICWGAVGAGLVCFQEALDFALRRKLHGRQTLAEKQLIQEQLAIMFNKIKNAYLLALELGRKKDEMHDNLPFAEVAQVKTYNVKEMWEVAKMAAMDIFSADIFTYEYHTQRHFRGLLSVHKYEGSHNVIRLMVGEAITGKRAY